MLDFMCVFTVVSNPFTGLECTEHTHYDAVFIASNTASQLNAMDFLRVLRTVGALTPVILMGSKGDLASYDVDYGAMFSSVLLKPFSEKSLCQLVFHIVNDSLAELPLPNIYGSASDPFSFPFHNTVEDDGSSSSDSSITNDMEAYLLFPPIPPIVNGSVSSRGPASSTASAASVSASSVRSRTSSSDSNQGVFFGESSATSGCSSSGSTCSNAAAAGVRNLTLDFDPEDVFQYRDEK
jgi:hypothetical protein